MATVDISSSVSSLLEDSSLLADLPVDVVEIIKDGTSTRILEAISQAALAPQLTDQIFALFEDCFPDICARWVAGPADEVRQTEIVAAFARILSSAPFLSVFLERCLDGGSERTDSHLASFAHSVTNGALPASALVRNLLAAWRLCNFDSQAFGRLIAPDLIHDLFTHEDAAVRYLAIRVFCQLCQASDAKLDALVAKHLPVNEPILGSFDGVEIDYGFLSLYERARFDRLVGLRSQPREPQILHSVVPQPLSPLVVRYGRAMLPRTLESVGLPSNLVMTDSINANLEQLARLLQRPEPILIHGVSGSGKTALVNEVARSVGAQSSMVTLHLNEQTDAKMLIGLYTTGATPGSFEWRAGILTTAVSEGRWVLIEDLDRAPNEVISTLLPLVERRELLIPNRGRRIRAPSGFRLIATVRSSRGGNEGLMPNLLGLRFWQSLSVQAPSEDELHQVVVGMFPMLQKYVPGIISVYRRLSRSGFSSTVPSSRSLVERQASLRDLLKWCRRLHELLVAAGCRTGEEPVNETTRERMFIEAVDCFVGSLPASKASEQMVHEIAEEMAMAREKVDHFLAAYTPTHEEDESHVTVGRVTLRRRRRTDRVGKSKRPFASTNHARRLLEQIAVSVKLGEPVLLVGETGIGKTTVVQQLANSLGHKLVAVNLSQQSESGDLLGGFKPVRVRSFAVPLKEEFEDLFSRTGISASKNQKYLDQIGKCFARSQWTRVSRLWREAPKMFKKIVGDLEAKERLANNDRCTAQDDDCNGQPAKRRRTESKLQGLVELAPRWDAFSLALDRFDVQIEGNSTSMAFSFVEGNIVKAARNGDWVLLDEINLATPDTLESVSDLLVGINESPSILLSETGEIERVKAHPDFRIFGAMNPATDVGKRDLPLGIRSRFTEFYVSGPDRDLKDLLTIIRTYLSTSGTKADQAAVDDIARLYLNTKRMAEEKQLVDGANEVPHFSLRTLTRVLTYVNDVSPLYGLRRALYEGFSMGFLTLLNNDSEKLLLPLMHHHLLDRRGGDGQRLLSQTPRHPGDGRAYVRFRSRRQDRQYWLLQGEQPPVERADYIMTPSVERNLLNVVRATSTRRFPILIQGPTSAGKTSMVEYLANFSGNKFVRINNHEHTDLQEYLGTYVSGPDGKLRFQEGLLVEAIRKGYWIVLDELNLAPTDVLEALNRLLDDNRELLIPETQEVVRPHENFILFATQNPPSLYGGRKVLSRAFRNRFLELHFDDIPQDELQTILQQRSRHTSPSDCARIVSVYKELSRLRQTSRLFEQKDSFATLRDLFRWAMRDADTREQIATNGFMLLAERVRNHEERAAVKAIIEAVFKVSIEPERLYGLESPLLAARDGDDDDNDASFFKRDNSQGVVWTLAMRRLFVLVSAALMNNEPVLLVGETGCGKTTVCQLLAEQLVKELHIVNAHQNTETGDLIGSQRPVRNRAAVVEALEGDLRAALRHVGQDIDDDAGGADLEGLLQLYHSLSSEALASLPLGLRERIAVYETKSKALFEWSDGSLVEAMKQGQFFLLDEISLAEDSVLERLNSVLEPGRSLLLAEKGSIDAHVAAADGFQFFATMNPGGDFGKKELSPALRNRFTEIWVPPLEDLADVREIVQSKLLAELQPYSDVVISFAAWFGETYRATATTRLSIREMLVWVGFANKLHGQGWGDARSIMVHGAATVFLDSLGANPSAVLAVDGDEIHRQRQRCLDKLGELLGGDVGEVYHRRPEFEVTSDRLVVGGFSHARLGGDGRHDQNFQEFAFDAPTTRLNTMRVLRALQMDKPILLEGSPGVGKTTLVTALAQACSMPLTRINLSDQTDLMDLFGTDVPVEGAEAGHFAWRDAPFLRAMQTGGWVLLDEMNLASQSVLEGLNACLDHRGEAYVAELDRVFKRHPDFRLFAAQNPHHQGGGRKGLPSSFVNRFVVVYADVLSAEDLQMIALHSFPRGGVSPREVQQLIGFVSRLEKRIVVERAFGAQGAPWEFNLRDVLRWLKLATSADPLLASAETSRFLDLVVRLRFRTDRDRAEVLRVFAQSFEGHAADHDTSMFHDINSDTFQAGMAFMARHPNRKPTPVPDFDVRPRLAEVEAVMVCAQHNMACILTGPSGAGKSALLQYVAALAGQRLVVFPLNADTDTMDLVGGFEQADPQREINMELGRLEELLRETVLALLPGSVPAQAMRVLHLLSAYLENGGDDAHVEALISAIETLLPSLDPTDDSLLSRALHGAPFQLRRPRKLTSPRFEWTDGVIVKAVQQGHWLVLDNANLCSASVLDRLNSLLEPGGCLSINEHCEPGGEPRVVRPHGNFRVFLTVDARYGELSRAMRNRAVEIYLGPLEEGEGRLVNQRVGVTEVEGGLQRFQRVMGGTGPEAQARLALENLSARDLGLLPRWAGAVKRGMLAQKNCGDYGYAETVRKAMEFLASTSASKVRNAYTEWQATALGPQWAALAPAQPLHPLHNAPIVRVLNHHPNETDRPFRAATLLDGLAQNQALVSAVEAESRTAASGTMASLNRLQRSVLARRIAAVSKDSTARVYGFLLEMARAVEAWLFEGADGEQIAGVRERRRMMRVVLLFLGRTFRFVTAGVFDEAMFLAHLAQGAKLMRSLDETRDHGNVTRAYNEDSLVSTFLQRLQQDFDIGFGLTTGLSMQQLWTHFRPAPITTIAALRQSGEIERLAMKLDSLRWRTTTPLDSIVSLQITLSRAYRLVRNDGRNAGDLVEELSAAIAALEAQADREAEGVRPFLAAEFEALRRAVVLGDLNSLDDTIISDEDRVLTVLADFETIEQMRVDSVDGRVAARTQTLDYILCSGDWTSDGRLTTKLAAKLGAAPSVSLASLGLLETELPLLGRYVAGRSVDVIGDSSQALGVLLAQILDGIAAAHGDERLREAFGQARSLARSRQTAGVRFDELEHIVRDSIHASCVDAADTLPPHVAQVTADHFAPAIAALACLDAPSKADRRLLAALGWTHVGVGAIKLFVPNKPCDPQLPPMLDEQFHTELRRSIEAARSDLVAFEEGFTRRRTNLRVQILDQELEDVGPPPAAVTLAYRPAEAVQAAPLQSTFNNVLKLATDPRLVGMYADIEGTMADDIRLVRDNLRTLVERLRGNFDAYQDVTWPVVGFLRSLELGLTFGLEYRDALQQREGTSLLPVTPFMGGHMWTLDATQLPTGSVEFFGFLNVAVSVEGMHRIAPRHRISMLTTIHSFYLQWSKKVEADRRADEARNNLYRFRGSLEDEEEVDAQEFRDLFPTFEEDEENDNKNGEEGGAKNRKLDVRATTIRIADAHRRLFLESGDSVDGLQALITTVMGRLSTSDDNDDDTKILPSAIVALDAHLGALGATDVRKATYNFYEDANLPEARRLVALTTKIQTRFRALRAIDEIAHMEPLADVLTACTALLEVPHAAPLAKMLPRLEALHGRVYEWQFGGWAPRAHLVPELHDAVTDNIIRWRRLELATWARLLDAEVRGCEEDAKSWWFVAYEMIVAYPLSLLGDEQDESQDDSQRLLAEYAGKMVRDLEAYMASTVVGQFSARMTLLRQLLAHLALLAAEYPALAVVAGALRSFVGYHARFEPVAAETIRRGRAPVEKSMRDVLLVASWKDTNINALRESARKSHLKLFRIVRKFRGVLGQDVRPLLEKGVPEEGGDVVKFQEDEHEREFVESVFDEQVLEKTLSPSWLQTHRRLRDASKTVSIMKRTATLPATALDAPAAMHAFSTDLADAISELRKATPTVLTEENTPEVKHLKTRKRKLFADTLRDMRAMGFKYTLSLAKLVQQASLDVVFGSVSPLGLEGVGVDTGAVDGVYFKTLELMAKARLAARKHSDDLSEIDVSRSVGYLEGILFVVLGQRRGVAAAGRAIAKFGALLRQCRALASDAGGDGFQVQLATASDWRRVLRWLGCVVEFGIRLVGMHAAMGRCDNGVVVEKLKAWAERFVALTQRLDLCELPGSHVTDRLRTVEEASVEAQFSTDLASFIDDVKGLSADHPSLAFILEQMLSWTVVTRHALPPLAADAQLEEFAGGVSRLCDSVLRAFENLAAKMDALPASTEDESWATTYDAATQAMMQALRVDAISDKTATCLEGLLRLGLDNGDVSKTASAVLALALPILEEYSSVCRQRLGATLALHHATVRTARDLTRSFIRLATDGFCTPPEKSDEQDSAAGKEGQLEAGTGLGDGEGEKDISGDVKPDEDLTDLAQEPNKERKEGEDMEDVEDAVDMAGEEMEGEMGSARGEDDEEKKDEEGDEEDEENDMDEEAGEVDDLDPTAIDEKMWDGDGEKGDKEQQGNQEKGSKDTDEQVAADAEAKVGEQNEKENDKPEDGESEDGERPGGEQDEEEDAGVTHEEERVEQADDLNRQDQNVREDDALALPEDMELDLGDEDGGEGSGDELDDFSDLGDPLDEEKKEGEDAEVREDEVVGEDDDAKVEESKPVDEGGEEEMDQGEGEGKIEEDQDVMDEDGQEEGEPAPEKPEDAREQRHHDETSAQDAVPSDVKNGGADHADDADDKMDVEDAFADQAANNGGGDQGETAVDDEHDADGQGGQDVSRDAQKDGESKQDEEAAPREDPFRKLGDALERWHRRQQAIQEAGDEGREDQAEEGVAKGEFEHVKSEEERGDTQALGAARDEEVRPFDDAMAVDEEDKGESAVRAEQHVEEQDEDGDELMGGDAEDRDNDNNNELDDLQAGARTHKGAFDCETSEPPPEPTMPNAEDDDAGEVDETSTQLETTHLGESDEERVDHATALAQWSALSTTTHALSASLSSQLRLILTPSQATKLSGAFRTGKRLNIKRIIPYIASSYKRDKIWMRRAVPSKRAYQILLCVDDSKSMGDSRAGGMALEGLVMVLRALGMLEAGEVGVVGFGEDVFDAQVLGEGNGGVMGVEAGARVLERFLFHQDRTDVRALIAGVIERFREARVRRGAGAGGELWQLAMILSDGLTPSAAHEGIRRLLREAMEERIMVVFIIMDDVSSASDQALDNNNNSSSNNNQAPLPARGRTTKPRNSVLDLREARFVPDGQGGSEVVIERYLDSFPFQYYLIVRRLEDLPGALAGLLRSWFAEVAGGF